MLGGVFFARRFRSGMGRLISDIVLVVFVDVQ